MNAPIKTLVYVSFFAIAMGFFESAVVIYLRELYYKDGFQFPLKPMEISIARVEVLREAATIIMLIAVGYLAGKTKLQRFAYFNFAFAIWDLCYYLFLYIFIGWPSSLFTWDILFLIPAPWIGPVWAPCLLALVMMLGSVFVIVQCHRQPQYRVMLKHWLLLIGGALVCIVAFLWDYIMYQAQQQTLSLSDEKLNALAHYVPASFNTLLFASGLVLMCLPVFYHVFQSLKIKSSINR